MERFESIKTDRLMDLLDANARGIARDVARGEQPLPYMVANFAAIEAVINERINRAEAAAARLDAMSL